MGLYDRDYMRAPRSTGYSSVRKSVTRVAPTTSGRCPSGTRSFGGSAINLVIATCGCVALILLCWNSYQPNKAIPFHMPGFSKTHGDSVVGTWKLDTAASIDWRRRMLEAEFNDIAASELAAQFMGDLTQISLENQAAHWELKLKVRSDNTYTISESTSLTGDIQLEGTWATNNESPTKIVFKSRGVRDYFGRIEKGRLYLYFIEPSMKSEFPMAVLKKASWF